MEALEYSERRSSPRLDADLPVELLESTERPLNTTLQGRVLNISRDGLKVRFWHDAQPGCRFSLSISFNGRESICLGEVVWKRDSTSGMIFGLRVKHWTVLDPELGHCLDVSSGPALDAAR
jgi:hypothetical protein